MGVAKEYQHLWWPGIVCVDFWFGTNIFVLIFERFTIHKTRQQTDGLVIADVEVLEEKQQQTIPEHYKYMLELLRHVKPDKSQVAISEEDFNQTIFQLIFLLPLDNTLKQRLLEIPSCLDRAAILHAELIRLGVIQYIEPTLSS